MKGGKGKLTTHFLEYIQAVRLNFSLEFPDEALKKIKTQEEFESFIQELYKLGVEALMKAEINEHLGYPKHDPSGKNSDSRNGTSRKTLKTNIGEVPLDVPRDRNATFDPIVVPKHQRMSAKIEHAIITMYSRGMTTRDIEATIKDIYGVEISEGSILTLQAKFWKTSRSGSNDLLSLFTSLSGWMVLLKRFVKTVRLRVKLFI